MVALLQPSRTQPSRTSLTRRPSAGPTRSHLRLVEAPVARPSRSAASALRTADPLSIVGVTAFMVMVLLVVLVRGVQGAPPADSWSALAEPAPAVAISTDLGGAATVTVLEADTWATIAARVAPEGDPVIVARSLAAANGGYQLVAGQVLVVPPAG